MNSNEIKSSYDKFPYKSKSFSQSNPNKLNFISKLMGLNPKEIQNSRILEIGCSYGGNIIPIAVGFDDVEVVGIDLSKVQINKGKELIEKMGLENIKLYSMNILDYKGEFGKFDYIICHGVYSWVPKVVQDKILEVVKSSLNENGIAHISYNTYPGWKSLDVYKNSMKFRKEFLKNEGIILNEKDTVALGRGMIEFIKNNTNLSPEIKGRADSILKSDSYYLYHEYFETENNPSYLFDFNEELEKNGLFHMCDTNLIKSIIPNNFVDILERECGDDYVSKEQYLDFINNCQFRNSVITHIENKKNYININRAEFLNIKDFYIRLPFFYSTKEKNKTKLIEKLKLNFPNNVNITEFLNDDEIDKTELFSMIINEELRLEVLKTNIISKEKPKLKEKYVKYIELFTKNEDMPIEISDKFGYSITSNDVDSEIILLFNGENTIKDIENIIKEKINNQTIKANSNIKDLDTFIEKYVKIQKLFIEYAEIID